MDDEDHEPDENENASPLSDRLAASGYFRASDPGRFAGSSHVQDVHEIVPMKSGSSAKKEGLIGRQSDNLEGDEERKQGAASSHL